MSPIDDTTDITAISPFATHLYIVNISVVSQRYQIEINKAKNNMTYSPIITLAEIVPGRLLNHLYVYLDIVFLVIFLGLLLLSKRYLTALFALAGGVIYFIVDYGIFYLLLQTRVVIGAPYFSFLLWLSMSYGITNFAWIWLWLKRDSRLLEWSLLIVSWWLSAPLIARTFGPAFGEIEIYRGTGQYHGVMAIFLFVGYAGIIIYNILQKNRDDRINLLWLLAIGILVQFAWEVALHLGGIRQGGLETIPVNSLLETNMGIPYLYFIQKAIFKRRNENLTKAATTQRGG